MHACKFLFIAALVGASAVASAQTADEGFYGEVGYSAQTLSSSGISPTMGILAMTIGKGITPNLAVEGFLGFGVSNGKFSASGTDYTIKMNNTYGVFVKPKVKLNNEVEAFGRLGYVISASTVSTPSSNTNSDFAYGLGLNYMVAKATYLSLDYTSYYNKNSESVKGFTFGVGFKF